jgi:hypothetical protein
MSQKRFGDSPAVEINNVNTPPIISESALCKILDRVYTKKIESAPPPKQIQDAEIVPECIAKNE